MLAKADIDIDFEEREIPEFSDLRLEILKDAEPESPRNAQGAFGTFVGFKGGEHHLTDAKAEKAFRTPLDVQHFIKVNECAYLPVYILSRKRESVSTEPFSDPWDSTLLGMIFATKKEIADRFGDASDKSVELAKDQLDEEVRKLDFYLCGEAYAYRITKNGNPLASEPLEGGIFYGQANCVEAAVYAYRTFIDNFRTEAMAAKWLGRDPRRYLDMPRKWQSKRLTEAYVKSGGDIMALDADLVSEYENRADPRPS